MTTAERKALFATTGQPWTAAWESLLDLHPDYFDAYLKLALVPFTNRHLTPKFQALVLLACDSSVTHLFVPGIRVHIENALRLGATRAEILEVLELTSVLGIHAITVGISLLSEVLDETPGPRAEMDEAELMRLSDAFKAVRGYDPRENWKAVMTGCPDFFEAYVGFSGIPFGASSALSAMEKELIYTAIDCATTHLFVVGLKLHIRNAVNYGATPQQVIEVLELASLMGVQTALVAAPILQELEAAR